MITLGIVLALAALVALQVCPRHPTLAEEERSLREDLRRRDRAGK
jgi:hypothetical protein